MPTRSCIICKKKNEKAELIRIVHYKDGDINLDKSQKENARGIYLCRNQECILKLEDKVKKNKFNIKGYTNNKRIYEILDDVKNELGE